MVCHKASPGVLKEFVTTAHYYCNIQLMVSVVCVRKRNNPQEVCNSLLEFLQELLVLEELLCGDVL